MRQILSKRPLAVVWAVSLIALLAVLNLSPVKAQYTHDSFISLLAQYTNKDVYVGGPSGNLYKSVIVEVGRDYITLEDGRKIRTAVPINSVISVRFEDVPTIRLSN